MNLILMINGWDIGEKRQHLIYGPKGSVGEKVEEMPLFDLKREQAWARLGSALVMLKLVSFFDCLVLKFQSDLK